MRMRYIITASVLLSVLALHEVAADERFSVEASYNVPIGNEAIDSNFGVGAQYRFWGVFTFSGTMYTEVLYGADNILNISQIRPIGLFSGGLGMKIPLGGFDLLFGWEKYFTGTSSDDGVFPFCDSYRIGASVDLSKSFGISIYSRRLFNFTDQAIEDASFRIETEEDAVETVGVALRFHLF